MQWQARLFTNSMSIPSLYSGESESEVAQSCSTLCDPMDYSLPGSSVYGIFQAIVLEWTAISLVASLFYCLKKPNNTVPNTV